MFLHSSSLDLSEKIKNIYQEGTILTLFCDLVPLILG